MKVPGSACLVRTVSMSSPEALPECMLFAMNTIDPTRCALVLVDYQARLMPAIHEADKAVAVAVKLADVARELGMPVLGTEQNPAGLGPNVEAIRTRCDATIAKMTFDGCADGLVEWLLGRGEAISDIVI